MRRRPAVAALAIAVLFGGIPAAAAPPVPRVHPCIPPGQAIEDPPPAYEWQGSSTARDIGVVSRHSQACLHATLYAPDPLPADPTPFIVLLPPTTGRAGTLDVRWGARALAGYGYIVITIDPQMQGQSEPIGFPACYPDPVAPRCPGLEDPGVNNVENYVDAAQSAIDFMQSDSDPYRSYIRADSIGIAGWSQGATASSFASGVDDRIDAVVGWDSLASTDNGDEGSPRCPGPQPNAPKVLARVPAMAQSSDRACDEETGGSDPELKKTAFRYFQAAGQPAMTLVMRDRPHGSWGDADNSEWHRYQAYYSIAWFDRWLKDDADATQRLLTPPLGKDYDYLLSHTFRSAVWIPGVIDCADLRRACSTEPDPDPDPTPTSTPTDPPPSPEPSPSGFRVCAAGRCVP